MTNFKSSELESIYNEYKAEADRRFVYEGVPNCYVWGFGDPDSPVVMIGEAPGKDEVALGRPFVGKAGKMLDDFLAGAGLERSQLFITNTVKYRLARPGKRQGTFANRPAKTAEIAFSAPYIKRELETLAPLAVVTLGNVPLKCVCMAFDIPAPGIGEAHGKTMALTDEIILYPMYHPASVIYNNSLETVYKKDLKNFSNIFSEISKKS